MNFISAFKKKNNFIPKIGKTNQIRQFNISKEIPSPNDIIPAACIIKKYKDDLDIIKIHEMIEIKFGSLLGQINEMKEYVKKLETEFNNEKIIIKKNEIRKNINLLNQTIVEIESGSKWNIYIEEAYPLLEEYFHLQKTDVNAVLTVIEKYLNIAKSYILLDISRIESLESTCPNCGAKMIDEDNENGCSCGYLLDVLDKTSCYKDYNRSNSQSKIYDSFTTFKKEYYKWKGVSNSIIPLELKASLDVYFKKIRYPIGDEVKLLPLNIHGKRHTTTVPLMVQALTATKNSKHFKILYPLIYDYWDWIKPMHKIDEMGIEESIFSFYSELQKIYEEIKTRKSCPNIAIRLYQILAGLEYPCQIEDFKTLTSRDCLIYINDMHKKSCKILNAEGKKIKFIPII